MIKGWILEAFLFVVVRIYEEIAPRTINSTSPTINLTLELNRITPPQNYWVGVENLQKMTA